MLRCFFIACKITFFISRRQVLTPHFFTADVLSINKEERGAVRRMGLTILGRGFKEDYTASAPAHFSDIQFPNHHKQHARCRANVLRAKRGVRHDGSCGRDRCATLAHGAKKQQLLQWSDGWRAVQSAAR